MQHGLGYAAGREDGSFQPTVLSAVDPGVSGFSAFAQAYAKSWDEYNAGTRGMMVSAQYAYDSWQRTGGRTIFAPIGTLDPDPAT
jgi:hypothetical protein